MILSVNNHSSIQIDDIFFDPFNIENKKIRQFNTNTQEFTNETNLIAENRHAKYIFITHTHFDHLSEDDIAKVANDDTIFISPKDAKEKLEKLLPSNKKIYISPFDNIEINNIKVEVLPAYNINKKFHPRQNDWVGYKLTLNGKTLAVLGDTDKTPELEKLKCDILFIPIGGTYTMTATEAAELANIIHPEIVIPVHYGSVVGSAADEVVFSKLLDKTISCITLID